MRQVRNRYQYIRGPIDRTKDAWARFQAGLSDPELGGTVHFIPAFGGCFVVIQPSHELGLRDAFRFVGGSPPAQPEVLLDRFAAWLGQAQTSRPIRRIVR